MIKRFAKTATALALMLCLILGSAVMAVPESGFSPMLRASAASIVDSGTCGDNVTWTLDNEGTLTISGTGNMADERVPVNDEDDVINVVIENGVTSIGDEAFSLFFDNITNITIPNSVTTIGYEAFCWCDAITSVTIPDSVTSIGRSAFWDCDSLTSVTVSGSLFDSFDFRDVFIGCDSLTNIYFSSESTDYSSEDGVVYNKDKTELIICPVGKSGDFVIPSTVTSIGEEAFYECRSLTSVTIPDSVTSIGEEAFYECRSLTSVTIPDSVTSIGGWAFRDCDSLTSVTIPDSVTSIGYYAFYSCDSLTSINISPNNTVYSSIDGVVYNKNKTALILFPCGRSGEFTIPSSVTNIEEHAFRGCRGPVSITLPAGITQMGNRWFFYCDGVESVTIPDSVTSIGTMTFAYSSLKSIVIPENVVSIGKCAFAANSSITSIVILNPSCDIFDTVNTISPRYDYDYNYNDDELDELLAVGEGVADEGSDDYENCLSKPFTIFGFSNSTAESYAEKYGRDFVALDSIAAPQNLRAVLSGGNICLSWDNDKNANGFNIYRSETQNGVYTKIGSVADKTYFVNDYIDEDYEDGKTYYYKVKAFVSAGGTEYESEPASAAANLMDIPVPSNVLAAQARGKITWDGVEGVTGYQIARADSEDGLYRPIDKTAELSFRDDSLFFRTTYRFYKVRAYVTVDGIEYYGGYSAAVMQYLSDGSEPGHGSSESDHGGETPGVSEPESDEPGYNYDTSLQCGETAFWTLDDNGVLTISGTGEITSSPWDNGDSPVYSVVIGEGITGIGARTFKGYRCEFLTSINVDPDNSEYSSLDGVLYNKDQTVLISCPLAKEEIEIPGSVTQIGNNAFEDCYALTSVDIPEGVTSIGLAAFSCCGSLTSVTIPVSVASIRAFAFESSDSLADVYYSGRAKEWYAIDVYDGNDNLTNANIHCSDEYIEGNHSGGGSYSYDTSGQCGDDAYWEVDDNGTLTISGTGAVYDYDYGGPWEPLEYRITEVVISDGITSIGSHALANLCSAEALAIPDSVVSIGDYAFNGFGAQQDLWGDDSVITIPASVSAIGIGAFSGFNRKLEAAPGNGYFKVENGVLFSKDGTRMLANLIDNEEADYIIPDGVTVIDADAFSGNNYDIRKITIPASATAIAPTAFTREYCVRQFIVDSANQNYKSEDGVLFSKDGTTLIAFPHNKTGAYVVPDGVKTIGDEAFSCCELLTDITIPYGVTSIGEFAFEGCRLLRSFDLPETVSTLGESALAMTNNVKRIVLYNTVTSMGMNAIETGYYDSERAAVYFYGTPEDWDSIENISYSSDADNIHYLTAGQQPGPLPDPEVIASGQCGDNAEWTLDECGTLTVSGTGPMYDWNDWDDIYAPWAGYESDTGNCITSYMVTHAVIEEGITNVGSYAFDSTNNLLDVTLPGTLTSIGDRAFTCLSYLEEIEIPEGVVSIGEGVFVGCDNLETITLPDSLVSIGESAFNDCDSIESINIPSGVETIDDFAFIACDSLTAINVDDANPWFRDIDGALCSKDGKKLIALPSGYSGKYTVPEGVETFDMTNAFQHCGKLTGLVLPEGIDDIPILFGCEALTELTIPASFEYISIYSMRDAPNITDIYYNGSEAMWFDRLGDLYDENGSAVIQTGEEYIAENGITVHFALETLPAPANLRSAPVSSEAISLSWDAVDGADGYVVYVYYDIENPYSDYEIGTTEETNFIDGGLESGVTKYYKVRAYSIVDGERLEGFFSDIVGATPLPSSSEISGDPEPSGSPALSDRIPGDVNNDGEVTTLDATLIKRYIAGGYNIPVFIEANADVNGDGETTTLDATLIKRYIAGGYGVVLR